jgi:hypothetical protein
MLIGDGHKLITEAGSKLTEIIRPERRSVDGEGVVKNGPYPPKPNFGSIFKNVRLKFGGSDDIAPTADRLKDDSTHSESCKLYITTWGDVWGDWTKPDTGYAVVKSSGMPAVSSD